MSRPFVNYVNVFVKYGCLAGLAVVLAILITGCSTADSSRQDRPAFITATGVGLTFDEAKENAFKQAIENRVGVLVMSDREIQSYKLVKDEILTYSAGYVDDYVLISQEKSGKKWVVTMQVWVSSSKLTSRIVSSKESGGKMNGKKVSESLTSFNKQKKQADDLTSKLLAGFPENALIAKFDRTELKFDSDRNALLIIYFHTSWNQGYLDSLNEVLSITQDGKARENVVGQVRVHYREKGAWFPKVKSYQFSDSKLMREFMQKFDNRRITVRLNLKYGNGTVFNNCWNLPDEYINSGYGQVVSILGHREYQSYITLTIPYGTSAQRMIENSDKVQLSIENSAACEKSNYIY